MLEPNRSSGRRLLVLSMTTTLLVIAGLGAYVAFTWPRSQSIPARPSGSFTPPRHASSVVPPYDGKEPFSLKIEGLPGLKLYLDTRDQVITPTILVLGKWEPAETGWFLRTVKPGDTVVDAGANVGYYTVIGSRLVGDKGKVYAFEPEPVSFAMLQKNVRLNGLTNVVLEQKALSNRKGILKLFIAHENKGDHRIYQPDGESRPSVDVEAVRLDEYFKDQQRAVNVIKMDTQGAEGLILEGMKGLLEGRTDGPTIFMEFWPHGLKGMGTDAGGLLKKLQSYDYRFYDINPKGKKGLPLVEPADLLVAHPVDAPDSQTDLLILRGGREPPKD
jgi:FkbM family methyltransferase